jgi:hypothetical protein
MVWGPLKQNYGGMRARIRARHMVQGFSAETLARISFQSAFVAERNFANSRNFSATLLMNYDVVFDYKARTMTLAAPRTVSTRRSACAVPRQSENGSCLD